MADYTNPGGYPYGMPHGYENKKDIKQRIKDYFLSGRYISLTAVMSVTGLGLVLYLVFSMLYSFILRGIPSVLERYLNDYMFSTVTEMLYTLVCVGGSFAAVYFILKKMGMYNGALPFSSPYNKSEALILVVAGTGICFVGNLATNFFVSAMSAVGVEFASYSFALTASHELPQNIFEFLCMVLHTAVFPAVFEEFAFRGVVMQPLRKYGDWFAIFVSAFLFGLVHGNMTQMPFAIIAGVSLGYCSTVTGSLWTGVIIHFFNNFLSLINSFAKEMLGKGETMLFSLIIVYGTILVGIVALAFYIYGNPDFLRLRPGIYGRHKIGRLAAICTLVPSMTIALIWLFVNLASDITLS